MLILVRPHVSLLDGPAVAAWLPRVGIHQAIFPVDPDYARHRIYGPLLKVYGILTGGHEMLPLDARHPFAMRRLLKWLNQGRDVVIFPQGTGLNIPDRPNMPGCQWLTSHTTCKTMEIILEHRGRWPRVAGVEEPAPYYP
ncbi:1-acyl-sn-glycerol-3-phosphate acyltransferase [Acidithiobacillus caldus]|uniref:1-acyl-sn-glycerol-3-phosphate acyltransferase n=1 Tax=Acidithiobacillus caldus TaxID=33059 RepID=UPI001C07EC23|nr:1-acyl-sn-glycerol-3-phosphate acyltransferase [Acidithiobacillus caldus]MBU2770101.1 1-acyl-sn-glycerol-3-phosphate acyltransferase [Acidithiobacillus caldus]